MFVQQHYYYVVAILVMLLISSHSFAVERYLSLSTGTFSPVSTSTVDRNLQSVTTSYSTGGAVGGAGGVSLDNGFRLENELVYRQANPDAWTLSWLINVWWDAKNTTPFTPYFGGGFGFGRGHASSPGIVDNDITGVAYHKCGLAATATSNA